MKACNNGFSIRQEMSSPIGVGDSPVSSCGVKQSCYQGVTTSAKQTKYHLVDTNIPGAITGCGNDNRKGAEWCRKSDKEYVLEGFEKVKIGNNGYTQRVFAGLERQLADDLKNINNLENQLATPSNRLDRSKIEYNLSKSKNSFLNTKMKISNIYNSMREDGILISPL